MPGAHASNTPVDIDLEFIEGRYTTLGDYTVDFLTFREDVDHRPLLKGLPDDRCQCPHWGYVFRGELTFHFADHDEVYHEGDAFYAPAGHVPVHTEPGSEYLQISPSDELRRTSEVIMKNFGALGEGH